MVIISNLHKWIVLFTVFSIIAFQCWRQWLHNNHISAVCMYVVDPWVLPVDFGRYLPLYAMLVKVEVAPLYKGLLPWQTETPIRLLIQSHTHCTISHTILDLQDTAIFSSSFCKTHSINPWMETWWGMKLLLQLEIFLTVSHLALALSSSNLANSLRSWMVMRSFQMSRPIRPNSRMAPATAKRTTKVSGPTGHSERAGKQAEKDYVKMSTWCL